MYKDILKGVKVKGLKRHSYWPTEKSVYKDIPTGVQSEMCAPAYTEKLLYGILKGERREECVETPI